jgi:nicotinamide riboside kinase
MTLTLALLGAESTGKTSLTQALAAHWQTQGLTVTVVAEVLREWCDAQGRTPKLYEQAGIAHTQAQRTRAAIASGAGVVIADTTPLMTAIYSEMIFQDRSLYDFARAHHRVYQHTLVMGLDLPWVPDGIQRDSPAVQVPVDAHVRRALTEAGTDFTVIYGSGTARLQSALRAVNAAQATSWPRTATDWVWPCDKCSDPGCEHRLFTDRLQAENGSHSLR